MDDEKNSPSRKDSFIDPKEDDSTLKKINITKEIMSKKTKASSKGSQAIDQKELINYNKDQEIIHHQEENSLSPPKLLPMVSHLYQVNESVLHQEENSLSPPKLLPMVSHVYQKNESVPHQDSLSPPKLIPMVSHVYQNNKESASTSKTITENKNKHTGTIRKQLVASASGKNISHVHQNTEELPSTSKTITENKNKHTGTIRKQSVASASGIVMKHVNRDKRSVPGTIESSRPVNMYEIPNEDLIVYENIYNKIRRNFPLVQPRYIRQTCENNWMTNLTHESFLFQLSNIMEHFFANQHERQVEDVSINDCDDEINHLIPNEPSPIHQNQHERQVEDVSINDCDDEINHLIPNEPSPIHVQVIASRDHGNAHALGNVVENNSSLPSETQTADAEKEDDDHDDVDDDKKTYKRESKNVFDFLNSQ